MAIGYVLRGAPHAGQYWAGGSKRGTERTVRPQRSQNLIRRRLMRPKRIDATSMNRAAGNPPSSQPNRVNKAEETTSQTGHNLRLRWALRLIQKRLLMPIMTRMMAMK